MRNITSFKAGQDDFISERYLSGLSTQWLSSLCPCSLPSPLGAPLPHEHNELVSRHSTPTPQFNDFSLCVLFMDFFFQDITEIGVQVSSIQLLRILVYLSFSKHTTEMSFYLNIVCKHLITIHYLLAVLQIFPEIGSFLSSLKVSVICSVIFEQIFTLPLFYSAEKV